MASKVVVIGDGRKARLLQLLANRVGEQLLTEGVPVLKAFKKNLDNARNELGLTDKTDKPSMMARRIRPLREIKGKTVDQTQLEGPQIAHPTETYVNLKDTSGGLYLYWTDGSLRQFGNRRIKLTRQNRKGIKAARRRMKHEAQVIRDEALVDDMVAQGQNVPEGAGWTDDQQ